MKQALTTLAELWGKDELIARAAARVRWGRSSRSRSPRPSPVTPRPGWSSRVTSSPATINADTKAKMGTDAKVFLFPAVAPAPRWSAAVTWPWH
ncbi:hypothetical protein SALBM311S_11739 [Streptomyces alboniger]